MATTQEINRILADGALAFPAYDKTRLAPALKHYVKALGGFDTRTIETAMDRAIQESKFFPSVAELVGWCRAAEANARPNQSAAQVYGDLLRERAHALSNRRAAGIFIPEEWTSLAQAFERNGRIEAARHLLCKAGLPFTPAPDPAVDRG